MYLIIEVQGRYAFVYRPYMFIVASIGLKNIIDFLKSKKVFEIQKAEYKWNEFMKVSNNLKNKIQI